MTTVNNLDQDQELMTIQYWIQVIQIQESYQFHRRNDSYSESKKVLALKITLLSQIFQRKLDGHSPYKEEETYKRYLKVKDKTQVFMIHRKYDLTLQTKNS